MSIETGARLTVEDVARVCHEANYGLCLAIGDVTGRWDIAPQWQKDSAVQGVVFALVHPEATPKDQHDAWLLAKKEAGWIYGMVKDEGAKTHPCFLPYDKLPVSQRSKDHLFQSIVRALSPFMEQD